MRTCLTLLAFLAFVGTVAAQSGNCRDGSCPQQESARPHPPGPLPPPVVTLQVIAPCRAEAGGEVAYEIVVTNRAAVPAHFVTVKDSLPTNAKLVKTDPPATQTGGELQWSLGTLAGGECKRLLLVLQSTGGDLENCVRVSYEHGTCVRTKIGGAAGPGGVGPDEEKMPRPGLLNAPKLDLVGDVPARVPSNTPFAAKFALRNPGEGTAKNLLLTAKLPAGLDYVSSSPPGELFEAGKVVRWRVADLEAKKDTTVELKLKGPGLGKQTFQVTAEGADNLKADRDFTVELFGGVGLHIELRDTVDPILVGDETEYDILVRNTGSVPATRVQLAAQAPNEIRLSRPRGPADDQNFKEGDPTLTFNPFNLQAGQEVTFRVNGKALKPGFAKLRVEMTADQLPSGPVLREEATNILADLPTGDLVTSAKPQVRAADWSEWLATTLSLANRQR